MPRGIWVKLTRRQWEILLEASGARRTDDPP